ncbi:hypothetical protein V8J36_14570 [Frigidibacter sp. MR17.14]|uniref:hypothetical protein n=1 Tax=Frigidibacter sp. MR17.14 TaxID=3126509 RepID=UPI003012F4B9
MKRGILIVACLSVIGLAACGNSKGMRVGTGALIGGGLAAATNNNVAAGAVAGGAVGALR